MGMAIKLIVEQTQTVMGIDQVIELELTQTTIQTITHLTRTRILPIPTQTVML
ncbi:hypothetical protein GW750_03435 [bacterium]|nr:hypothetical protein [bacterium]